MIEKFLKFTCDSQNCKNTANFPNVKMARAKHWSISHDRKLCYCPTCTPLHKNTGRAGAKFYEQARIDG